MDYLDYREKLGIGFNDKEKLRYFYNVLFNELDSLNTFLNPMPILLDNYKKYCNDAGVRGSFTDYYESYGMGNIIRSLHEASEESFNSLYGSMDIHQHTKSIFRL